MKHSLSRPAIRAAAAYLVVAAISAVGQGPGGFFLSLPWSAGVCLIGSDTALNWMVAGSIITNTLIVYLVVVTYLRLKADETGAEETSGLLLLTKRQLFVFATVAIVVTSPFLALMACGLKNEEALVLILPFFAGMPWVLLYFWLPFNIPGLTSAGIPDESGRLTVTYFELALLMLPVFLNIYIAVRLTSRGRRR